MTKIDKNTIDRIMAAVRIEEVVGDFITLRKTGVRYLGLCPFHKERHYGSFVVYPKGNCYKCFTCDAKGGAVEFLMKYGGMSYPDAMRWLAHKYGIVVDEDQTGDYVPPPPRSIPPPLPMLELPMRMVSVTEEAVDEDLLVRWIKTGIHWDSVQRKRIDQALRDYHIGHGKHGHTIFWQIDEHGRVRTGKMMKYQADGHRDKVGSWNFDWCHSALFRDRRLTEWDEKKQDVKPTLFGMHLLNHWKTATVCIVESEKTALLMAIAYGNHASQVWMACGGKENLSSAKLGAIMAQRRRIVLYPDRDAVGQWKQQAERLRYDRLVVDAAPVTEWWLPEDGEKADIADVVVRSLNSNVW